MSKYYSRDKEGMTYEYSVWKTMLRRCESNKNYSDCVVCDEWQNFQVFAKWLRNNRFYGFGYDLDKDILSKNNKVYSPETCCLVPREINLLFRSRKKPKDSKLPIGVSYNKRNKYKKYGTSLSMGSRGRKHLGYFICPKEASAAYVEAKEAYVKELALEWKDKIDPRAFEALMNWTVY